jgi:hypothetical protein
VGDLSGHRAPGDLLSLDTLYRSPRVIGGLHSHEAEAKRPRVETIRGQSHLLHSAELSAHILKVALLCLSLSYGAQGKET